MNRFVLCILVALLSVGCSLKENRLDCPSSVCLDLSEVEQRQVTVCVPEEDIFRQVNTEDSLMFRFQTKSRNPLIVSVFHGQGQCLYPDGEVRIPYGEDSPQLYSFYSEIHPEEIEVTLPVILLKNHCRLTLEFAAEDLPGITEITVLGNVDGYKSSGEVSQGRFKVELSLDEIDKSTSLILPRQIDNSLVLEASFEDRMLRTFALGEYIDKSGYDWTAENLSDLDVLIDLAHYTVFVTSSLWDEPKYFEIEI